MSDLPNQIPVVVIGGGFTGLAAAYEIASRGVGVAILEKDQEIGGLASSFEIGGHRLEKFYHHWFTNDEHVLQLAKQLGLEDHLLYKPTKTGIYLDKSLFKLSTPLDVLLFTPLNFLDRIRLGLLVLRAKRVKDWKQLESLTAEEWLIGLCGSRVYRIVWEPLLRGKFGLFASQVSAVWFWNKLLLRGGSRSKAGREVLVYYCGGFAAFAEAIANEIMSAGGTIHTDVSVEGLIVRDGSVKGVKTSQGMINAQAVIATPALPIIKQLLEPHVSDEYVADLKRVKYLANVCLVLELSQSLSDIYWLNVNDTGFPYVSVIEHTNFQPSETCGGRHVVYLSKYLPESDELYQMSEKQIFEFSLPHIKRMFSRFDKSWVLRYFVWKARYAQPVVVRHYSDLIPSNKTPVDGVYITNMAQIYPEDRGTNYAIRQGRHIGQIVAEYA